MLVAHSCSTLFDTIVCSPQTSSADGILQGRILEWGAMASSRDLPDQEVKCGSPAVQADSLSSGPPGKPLLMVKKMENNDEV